jgi:hypothetical protein
LFGGTRFDSRDGLGRRSCRLGSLRNKWLVGRELALLVRSRVLRHVFGLLVRQKVSILTNTPQPRRLQSVLRTADIESIRKTLLSYLG